MERSASETLPGKPPFLTRSGIEWHSPHGLARPILGQAEFASVHSALAGVTASIHILENKGAIERRAALTIPQS
jgi:hypothetical protein